MPGLRLDADQDRGVARLAMLHLGGELERVRRDDAVVVVGGRHERRRVLHTLADIVQGRILIDIVELLLVFARSVLHGFGMVKLEWDAKEQKFNSYFDVLKKQYSPDASDLKYISSLLETDVHITDKTTPKDVARVLMTKDEFDFTSTYYYGIRKMEVQEELQKLTAFLDKHNIPISDSIKKDIDELKGRIKYYESKSIIGNNKI